jgi:hypothetical protein
MGIEVKNAHFCMPNAEGIKAALNRFGSALEVAISSSYGGYSGLLRYQQGYPPVIIALSARARVLFTRLVIASWSSLATVLFSAFTMKTKQH